MLSRGDASRSREAIPLSQAPLYNLKSVLQETGIGADTLRAWERRYGLPKPQRTPGGHRLYSQRDIQVIKWLVARQAEGLSISRAVKRWNALAEAGEDPLAPIELPLRSGVGGSPSNLDTLREAWLTDCFRFDEVRAEFVLNQAFALYTVETVITEIILRGLREVGDRWHDGQATVQQEHFVSGQAIRRLDALISAAPIPIHAGTIVLACPPAELHSLPLLYLNVLLRRRGRNVVFLGADVPVENLEETTQAVNAKLVVMGAQRLATARALRDTARSLARKRVPIAYGGRVFNQDPELQQNIPGTYLGEALEGALDRIEELLASPAAPRKTGEATVNLTAQSYWAWRPDIEAVLQRNIGRPAEAVVDLTIANSYFGAALAAALEFGNVAHLAADMDWIRFLLTKPMLPFSSPRSYLIAYAAAIREAMRADGSEIAAQLEHYAEKAHLNP